MNGYNYARIKTFSNLGNQDTEVNSLEMCINDTMDRRFQLGGTVGVNSGPQNAQCQSYMADRCAKKWDGYCEYYYQNYGPNGPPQYQWPNTVWRPWEETLGMNQNISLGETLLKNTAERKYCELKQCKPVYTPLNPMDPFSPKVPIYQTYAGCVPECKVNPSTIDEDPVMNRLIANPRAGASTLINICNTSRNQGISLGSTKIGKLCEQYEINKTNL